MTQEQEFKIGDKVRYKAGQEEACQYNGHVFGEVYIIESIEKNRFGSTVDFKGHGKRCLDFRLELVDHEDKSHDHPLAHILRAIADGKVVQFRRNKFSTYVDLDTSNGVNVNLDFEYRLKDDVKTVKKYLILFKTTDCFRVRLSANYYTSVEEFESWFNDGQLEFAELVERSAIEVEVDN